MARNNQRIVLCTSLLLPLLRLSWGSNTAHVHTASLSSSSSASSSSSSSHLRNSRTHHTPSSSSSSSSSSSLTSLSTSSLAQQQQRHINTGETIDDSSSSSSSSQRWTTATTRRSLSDLSDRYPYVVSLQSDGRTVCAGSLIAKFAVLTSAQCEDAFDSVVVTGGGGKRGFSTKAEEDLWWMAQSSDNDNKNNDHNHGVEIETFTSFEEHPPIIHPNYNPTTFENDYMIVLLPSPVINPGVVPVELNRYDEVIPHELTLLSSSSSGAAGEETSRLAYVANGECERYGYSVLTRNENDSDSLMQVSYEGRIHESMMCAMQQNDDDAENTEDGMVDCNSNTMAVVGGPLIIKGSAHVDGDPLVPHDVLFGSVSWGGGGGRCGDDGGFPRVYSRVSTAVSWMEGVLCASYPLLMSNGMITTSSLLLPPSFSSCDDTNGGGARPNTTRTTASRINHAMQKQQQRQQQQQHQLRNTQSTAWPHSLSLEITFDGHPEQVSWKFENQRTSNVLAGVAFGEYPMDTYAGRTILIPLDILTGEDYKDDWMGSQPGVLRDYRFVIYDRGGNGLCCDSGNGKYTLYSKGTIVARGDSYGAIDEHFFSVDPRQYLDDNNANNNLPVVNIPLPAPNGNNNNSGDTNGANAFDNNNNNMVQQRPQPTDEPTTRRPTLPTMILSFFCGKTFSDAQENCPLPCPTGSPAECENNGLEEHTCYASTTCRERYVTPEPTRMPTTANPTERPTPPPTPRPTRPLPTPLPTPLPATRRPTRPPQTIPTMQMALDSNTWFCGVDWDWITAHCDEAIPCPRGDPVDCPANQACFASTPCTLSPTANPTTDPSASPTDRPTPNPTKSPWSEESFVDFLYGQSDGESNQAGNNAGGTGNQNVALASEVNEALENYNSLQYHFFCGISWTHADETCEIFCPSGDEGDCPDGQECYANTRCDGRDTSSPTTSPAPSILGAAANAFNSGGEGEVCALCDGAILDESRSVAFQTNTMTCGEVDRTIRSGNILVGSATCNNAREQYRSACCTEECQLCRDPDGDFLDLRERVVKQGGYEATCQEISTILSTTAKKDSLCTDAQSQLGGECCYEQCALCGDQSDTSTEWYATVTFEGFSTTCLGIDYMLRAEQVSNGSDRCSELQGAYMDRCCYAADSCQLCKADGKLYEVDPTKTVVAEQSFRSTVTTCTAIDEKMSKLGKSDQQCKEGKQNYFGQCCDVSDVGIANSGGSFNNVSPSQGLGPQQQPATGVGVPSNPSSGGAANSPTSPGMKGQPPLVPGSSSSPTSSSSPSFEGQTKTPVLDPIGSKYSWDQNWDPPNGGYRTATVSSLVIFGMSGVLSLFVCMF